MFAEVGHFLTGLALTVTLYAAGATFWSIRQDDRRWAKSGRHGVYATTALLGAAVVVLLAAFLNDQFQIKYVAEHSSRELPLYLKVSAVWGGQAGSLLLWSFLQALFAAIVIARPSHRSRSLLPWAAVFLSLITAFFVAVTLFLSNPFNRLPSVPANGQGLNPLLRHPGMIFHPPAMYVGYVGLAVPFALALAALATRQIDLWPTVARRWTLAAWLFLGLGLLLGARWAYDVLGWGGYWGWDPVENAGLMPWLTATALLHGTVMQEQRRNFRLWNLVLVVLSFALVLFGTFTTRSGLIQSVHAFARSNLGLYFLAFIGVTVFGSLVMGIWRRSLLSDAQPPDALISRQGAFLLTVILLLTITFSVFVGSVLPTLTDALFDQQFEAGPEWFDRVTGPQFAALVVLIGVCPLLGSAAAALRRLERRGWPALVGAALVPGAAALVGFTQPVSLIGFAIIGLGGATTVAEIVRDIAVRSEKRGQGPLQTLWDLIGRNRRKYGGYVVHAGVVLMAIGIIGTRMYPFETEVVLAQGTSAEVQDYRLVYQSLDMEPMEDHVTTWAAIEVYRDGAYLTTLYPRIENYSAFGQTVATPAVRPGLKEDLYLVLAGWSNETGTATVKVFVNSLATFLWLGGLVFLAGGAVALWPVAQPTRLATPAAQRRRWGNAVGLIAGLVVLALAVWAMWGTGQGTATPRQANPGGQEQGGLFPSTRGRIQPGEPAPDFALELLDGSTVALDDFQGQVAVVNLWATWCAPCEDELPDFQTVWEAYRDQGVVFVGVAAQEDEDEVATMVSRLGVTYPIGLDLDGGISADYGITGVPETFVVDSEGKIAYVHVGPVSAAQLRRELDILLAD
ncbi:MAG: cytochrome c-type biogenesis CcmF C-terminal domain-containing protein [Anaerolineae bacterium]|jgi:cytochrome c-type biogenesis protein CcmF